MKKRAKRKYQQSPKQKRKRLAVARVMQAMDLPEETDSGLVKITMLGHKRALIENHKGVYAYTEEGISLTGAEGIISLCGKELEIRQLDSERISVEGYITGVSYE